MNVNFLSIAEREYVEAIEYYNQEQPGLGFEFAAGVDSAIQRILELSWFSVKWNFPILK